MRFISAHNSKKNSITKWSTKMTFTALAASIALTPALYASSLNTAIQSESPATLSTAVTITKSQGETESVFAEWKPVADATGYNVYYTNTSDNDYHQLDTQLIRQYSSYMRADVLGLEEGEYILKVVPIINNKEDLSKQASTGVLTVQAHTREGFAFSSASPMGTGSGGYNDDGSISSNAQILHISSDNINTIALDVITSSKNTTTKAVGLADILAKRQKGYDKRPLIIRLTGTIKNTDINGLNSSGYLQLKGLYNVTLEGIGEDATAYGFGLLIRDSHNVEIRNLGFMLFPDDAISLDTNNENIWVHNNDIFYGKAGSDADQAKGDGSADVKGKSNFVTISYNHFFDSGKSSLCGMSDTENFYVTYHHNWYDHSDSRHPRIRVGTVHIYNNYFDGNSKYGVGITKGGSAFVEANYFRNCKYPMLISLQGTDIYGGSKGTFSGEPGGMIKAYNNTVEGAARLVYHTADSRQFDAYLANTRNEAVPNTYKSVSGGNTYNNFDTSSVMYNYTADSPNDVESIVTTYAGRMNGGDFSWEFTSADDTDYSVNKALMSAILNYSSDLISIGGNSVITVPPVDDNTGSGSGDNSDSDNIGSGSGDNSNNGNTGSGSGDNSDSGNTGSGSGDSSDNGNTGSGSGDNSDSNTGESDSDDSNNEVASNSFIHNFTLNGKDSDFFSVTGNLSSSKGTVSYNDLLLKQCLKLESSTQVRFTLEQTADLTLVFNSDFNKSVLIDGTEYTAENGILTATLEKGNHTITKGDTANLYYMAAVYEQAAEEKPLPVIHNFTNDEKESPVFSITGNLSSSKGTVSYEDLMLTQCLKLESSTLIAFDTVKPAQLTLVLNSNFNGDLLIDSEIYTADSGIIEINLSVGSHTIRKIDVANLFYMALSY